MQTNEIIYESVIYATVVQEKKMISYHSDVFLARPFAWINPRYNLHTISDRPNP